MTELATALPCCRAELIIAPAGETGRYVVKDPRARTYFQLGEEEHFLLTRLNGNHSAEVICAAFAERFGQALTAEELAEFIETARSQGFLQGEPTSGNSAGAVPRRQPEPLLLPPRAPGPAGPRRASWQSVLYWRVNLFDPDRLFTWLEPKIRFFWTGAFLVLSAVSIAVAAVVVWFDRQELAGSLASAMRWEMAVLTWFVLFGVTTLHKFAHGLTCKHHGGEVHEMMTTRHTRTASWLLGRCGLGAVLGMVEIEDRAGAAFRLRPAARAELRAPVAGFLREIYCDAGDRVSPSASVARLEVPDLESRLVQKQAEVLPLAI